MTLWMPPARTFRGPEEPAAPFSLPMPIVYDENPERVKWEYHVVTVDLREQAPLGDEELAALGADGWLLASVVQPPAAREPSHTLIYYFVRQA